MNLRLLCISALVVCLPMSGCGRKKKSSKEILHAPDELLVNSPLSLAGSNPDQRDEANFNRCISGSADSEVLSKCQLPYLDFDNVAGTTQVDAILSNTLISHPWQSDRFKKFLQSARPEILSMFSCVKGVAISGDIRPSFYYPPSGAIYLDAGYFVESKEENDTVSKAPDSREQNFDQLNLLFFTVDSIRKETLAESRRSDLERLLAHELAHACDFKAEALTGKFLSDELPKAPENAVYHLAKWLYFADANSKALLKNFSPADIGKSFEDGPVIDIYGYGNQFEHLAMVVQNHLTFEFSDNIRTDLLTDNPKAKEKLRQFPIYWGMKGKFCQPDLFELGRALTQKTVPVEILFQKAQTDCQSTSYVAGTKVYEALGISADPIAAAVEAYASKGKLSENALAK